MGPPAGSGGFRVDFVLVPHPTVLAGGIVASKGPGLFFSDPAAVTDFQRDGREWRQRVHVLPLGQPLTALERIDAASLGGRVSDPSFGPGYVLWQEYAHDPDPIWRGARAAYRPVKRSAMLLRPHHAVRGPAPCVLHGGADAARGRNACATF